MLLIALLLGTITICIVNISIGIAMRLLKREEILKLAQQAKLMYLDGDACYLNELATDKEVMSLVRLIEAAQKHSTGNLSLEKAQPA
jgi:hypothetical protein